MFTRFYDMYSGGRRKTEWEVIYVELPYDYAIVWFEKQFGRDPNNETCNCCGSDYSIDECKTPESDYYFDSNAKVFMREEIGL